MTYVHWMQALWFVITATQCVQLYFVRKTRIKLNSMVRTFERINATLAPYPAATTNTNPQWEEPRA